MIIHKFLMIISQQLNIIYSFEGKVSVSDSDKYEPEDVDKSSQSEAVSVESSKRNQPTDSSQDLSNDDDDDDSSQDFKNLSKKPKSAAPGKRRSATGANKGTLKK